MHFQGYVALGGAKGIFKNYLALSGANVGFALKESDFEWSRLLICTLSGMWVSMELTLVTYFSRYLALSGYNNGYALQEIEWHCMELILVKCGFEQS